MCCRIDFVPVYTHVHASWNLTIQCDYTSCLHMINIWCSYCAESLEWFWKLGTVLIVAHGIILIQETMTVRLKKWTLYIIVPFQNYISLFDDSKCMETTFKELYYLIASSVCVNKTHAIYIPKGKKREESTSSYLSYISLFDDSKCMETIQVYENNC